MRGRTLAWTLVTALAIPSALAGSRIAPDGSGGGGVRFEEHAPHLTDDERREIERTIDANVQRLLGEGRLAWPKGAAVRLIWPLRAANGLSDQGYAGISNYVDHDPVINSLIDWNCGTRSYDRTNGYNHQGTDIFTWPFGWYKMDNDEVEVVAGADGTIVFRQDGFYDRSCGFGGGSWNAVYVRHADGTIAWYGHMKNGSLTTKGVGATVVAGERLGVVGSSGNSTGPHLHLELYDGTGNLLDPYAGPCNTLNAQSLWVDQEAYREPQINRLQSGPVAVVFPTCPTTETPNAQNVFNRGDTIYFTSFYRDQQLGQLAIHRIRWPNGTIHNQWQFASPDTYDASWWYWFFTNFAAGGYPIGIWTYEIEFAGETYIHYFAVGTPAESGAADGLRLARGARGTLSLDWDPSCNSLDTDYEIYEGTIGDWYSHRQVTCSTNGQTEASLTPDAGGTYYLVVPDNRVHQGSYGVDGTGAERPDAFDACLPRVLGVCR